MSNRIEHLETPGGNARARGLGIPFAGEPGRFNAITDVAGVEVGHVTLIEGDGPLIAGEGPVRTGVSAILPRGRDSALACAAGRATLNGNGELTGSHWIDEVGAIASPILLTNTFAVGECHRGIVDWFTQRGSADPAWIFPVVGETYDGYLNDIAGSHVGRRHALEAIAGAHSGPIEEGSVGGGTGMNSYGLKGGVGTASRVVNYRETQFHVAAYVQSNFGARPELTIAGVNVGQMLSTPNPMQDGEWGLTPGSGSIIVVVATDAPVLPHQCSALARRAGVGLARTGTTGSHHSGDIFLAFSTANTGALTSIHPKDPGAVGRPSLEQMTYLPWGEMDPFYAAAAHAVEEAVVNALVANHSMTGRDGHVSPALPHAELQEILRRNAISLSNVNLGGNSNEH